ncbi:unnamed protein product, partial [Medioppia subpectinata]
MAIDIYSANNTMKRLIDLNCFNNYERNRLDELFSLSLFDKSYLDEPKFIHSDVSDFKYQLVVSADYIMKESVKKFDQNMAKFVNNIQPLKAFQNICFNDRIAMIKYGCIEINLLKTCSFYKYEIAGWYLPLREYNNFWVCVPLDTITGLKNNVISLLSIYLNTFVTEFDSDIHIIELLMPLMLFNPDRPNIINRDVIEQQQQLYLYLLRKYLRIKYGNDFDDKN